MTFSPSPYSNVLALACAPLPVVRIGFIGLGQRGLKTIERYADVDGAEITCVADVEEERTEAANALLVSSGRKTARRFSGEHRWREVCQQADVDLVYICTDWSSHCRMAVEAMRCGKHVAVEVPAATTVEECFMLVRTAEETRRHCFMTENCCYDNFHLSTLEMQRQGLLGHITHCEGAYIHCLKNIPTYEKHPSVAKGNWMEKGMTHHGGNPYPTHGIGPIAQLLHIHRPGGDSFASLSSVTSTAYTGEEGASSINTTLLRTRHGVSIMLQLDVTTPRPYSRLQTVCGTRGFVQKYPLPTVSLAGEEAVSGAEAEAAMAKFATSHAALLWKKGMYAGVQNAMNYAMDCRLIHCLQCGLPLDMDVYDAAEWSCLAELTQRSAQRGGEVVEVPKFV